jgi:hypothetical protein
MSARRAGDSDFTDGAIVYLTKHKYKRPPPKTCCLENRGIREFESEWKLGGSSAVELSITLE